MKNLIPRFIHDQYKGNSLEGDFSATAMFMDISGFTTMTEKLMNHGKEGAEILSDILNDVFDPVSDAIYKRGGYISGFAGDALTAIFPFIDNRANLEVVFSAVAIKELFKKKRTQKTRFGDFELYVKLGLSAGPVHWGIAGAKNRKTYYFKGPAIVGCANSEHQCNKMDIVLDENLFHLLRKAGSPWRPFFAMEKLDNGYFKLAATAVTTILASYDTTPPGGTTRTFPGQDPDSRSREEEDGGKILAEKVLAKFVPDSILSHKHRGEFRHIVSVFISFVEPDGFLELNEFVRNVLNEVETFGGYFNSLDFGDKGGAILIIFGAPVSNEDSLKRAMNFLIWLKGKFKNKIRAGVTQGTVYAGFIGSERRCAYTCLGDVVNMSARLMMKAGFGKVWITETIKKKLGGKYKTKDSGLQRLKGLSRPVPVFELLEEIATSQKLYESEMVSREPELEKLKGYCKPILDGKFGGVVYVYGEAGAGKSRLLYELTQKLENNNGAQICVLQADGILKKGLNPFLYFFKDYFNQYEETALDRRKIKFAKAYDKLMEDLKSFLKLGEAENIIRELVRIKPIIGAVLGLRWEGSIYENIDPKDRPEVTRFAIKEFFKALSRFGPVVLLLEDIHWLDNESQNVFKIFTRQMEEYPIIILATGRLNDDGSKSKLKIDEDSLQNEMTLGYLPFKSAELFVSNQLKGKVDDDLLLFVFNRTEGNPFYMEQFCLYLKETFLINLEEGRYKLKKAITDVPVGINAILTARIDRLSAELNEMAQAASVLGREFEVQILLELIRIIRSSAAKDGRKQVKDERLEHILSEGIIERVWNVLSEIKYIFKHALLRDAVYEMQLKSRLRSLHKIAGEVMVKLYPEDKTRYSDIAFHCNKAEQKEKAKDYYSKAGDYAKEIFEADPAIDCYNKALAVCLELFGEKHPETAQSYTNIGEVYKEKGDYDKAQGYFTKAFAIRIEILGEKHPNTAESYNSMGRVYWNKGEYDKALEYSNKALAIQTEVFGKKHPDTAESYNNIGEVYEEKGDYDKALEYSNNALAIRIGIFGGKHPDTADSYNSIGMVYWKKGEYEKALEYHNKALAIRIAILGEKHPDTATSYNNIGAVYHYKGDYDKALEYENNALAILSEILGEKHTSTAASYNNIGGVNLEKGDYDKALEYFNKDLAINLEILGEKHPATATSYNNMGSVYCNKGDYDKALEYLNKALVVQIEVLGEKHPLTATSYNNIGRIFFKKDNHDKALIYYNKSVAIKIELLGEKHPATAITYNNIGKTYKGKVDLGKALEYYNKALEIYKEIKNEKGISEVMKNIEEIEKCPKAQ